MGAEKRLQKWDVAEGRCMNGPFHLVRGTLPQHADMRNAEPCGPVDGAWEEE